MSMIDEFNNKSIIPTEFNTSSTFKAPIIDSTSQIPIIVKTKSQQPTVYGDAARDAFLQLQLDNETGNYLTLERLENKAILSLWSKKHKLLSSVDLLYELPSKLGIRDKYLYIDTQGNLVWQAGTGGGSSVQIKYDTTAGWNSHPEIISQKGTLYIYTDKDHIVEDGIEKEVPGIKIGDGNAYLIDKAFITDAVEKKLINHMNDLLSHVSAEDRERWDNKLNYIDPGTSDLLEFTRK